MRKLTLGAVDSVTDGLELLDGRRLGSTEGRSDGKRLGSRVKDGKEDGTMLGSTDGTELTLLGNCDGLDDDWVGLDDCDGCEEGLRDL